MKLLLIDLESVLDKLIWPAALLVLAAVVHAFFGRPKSRAEIHESESRAERNEKEMFFLEMDKFRELMTELYAAKRQSIEQEDLLLNSRLEKAATDETIKKLIADMENCDEHRDSCKEIKARMVECLVRVEEAMTPKHTGDELFHLVRGLRLELDSTQLR